MNKINLKSIKALISTEYSGFIAVILYGLFFGMLKIDSLDISDLMGILFILFIPTLLSILPFFKLVNHIKNYKLKSFFYPFASISIFILTSNLTSSNFTFHAFSLRSLLFLFAVSTPFSLISGILGMLIVGIIKENSTS